MTTAHRPTWRSAMGSENGGYIQVVPSQAYSARSVKGYTKLKERKPGQGTQEEIKEKLLKKELEEREFKSLAKRSREEEDEEELYEPKRVKLLEGKKETKYDPNTNPLDRDDSDSSDDESDDSDVDSDDEEMAEIQRTLEYIKLMQEKEKLEKEMKEKEEMDRIKMSSNPLLAEGGFTIKKKWYEDTVFRNQAKQEKPYKKRFINDTVRNDFHKRFLDKYIR